MHLVRFSCLPIVTLVSLLLHCRRPRRFRESATSALSSGATVSFVSASADAVIDVRARILPVTRSPVCVAAVFDAVDAADNFSIVSECRCWNRLGRH